MGAAARQVAESTYDLAKTSNAVAELAAAP
jgi:hypothetical protein